RLPGTVLRGLEGLVDGQIDALDHRRQDGARLDVVLVRVDADGETAPVLRRLEHTQPGRAGGSVDNVGAPIELAPLRLAAACRIVPRRRRRTRHVLVDLDLRVDVLGALDVADGE